MLANVKAKKAKSSTMYKTTPTGTSLVYHHQFPELVLDLDLNKFQQLNSSVIIFDRINDKLDSTFKNRVFFKI
jgi:hypothetical protein